MSIFPETRESLIIQVQDRENRESWEVFSQIYRPVIYRIARSRGLQDADAHDLAQQVLLNVANAIGRWKIRDESTRFRHWLSRITRNAVLNALTRPPGDLAIGGTSIHETMLKVSSPDHHFNDQIEDEFRRELYLRAAETVKANVESSTWEAFERSVVHGYEIREVAAQLKMTTGAVYTARSRVMFKLRVEVQTLQKEF